MRDAVWSNLGKAAMEDLNAISLTFLAYMKDAICAGPSGLMKSLD